MSDLRRAAILIKTASCAYMRYDSNAACVHVCAQPAVTTCATQSFRGTEKKLLLCSVLQTLRTALVKNRLTSYKSDTMYQAQRDPYPSQFMPHFIWTK